MATGEAIQTGGGRSWCRRAKVQDGHRLRDWTPHNLMPGIKEDKVIRPSKLKGLENQGCGDHPAWLDAHLEVTRKL